MEALGPAPVMSYTVMSKIDMGICAHGERETGFCTGDIKVTLPTRVGGGGVGTNLGRPEGQLAPLPTPLSSPPLSRERLHRSNNTIDLLKSVQVCTWLPQLPTPSVQVVTTAQVVRP